MFKVLNENEMPSKNDVDSTRSKYPRLEIGQGFEIKPDQMKKSFELVRGSAIQAYRHRGQKVTTMTSETGSLFVKRIK